MNIETVQDRYAALLRAAAKIENARLNTPKDPGQAIAIINRAKLLASLGSEPLETAAIAERVGIMPKTAQRWLARLEREGAAIRVVEARGGGQGGNLHKWRLP